MTFIPQLEILKILDWVINFKVPLIFTLGARVLEKFLFNSRVVQIIA